MYQVGVEMSQAYPIETAEDVLGLVERAELASWWKRQKAIPI
jgi:hypothetical protein